MTRPSNALQLHHEWDALTRAALESDPPPENDFALAGWQHLRQLTCQLLSGKFSGLPENLRQAVDRDLLARLLSWVEVEPEGAVPPCRIVDKQWDPRSRQLLVSLVEGPSVLARALDLDILATYFRHCGQTNHWRLTDIAGLIHRPPLILPVFETPGPRLRVSDLAF